MSRQHKSPCRECPFRRAAPAGWLGGFTPAEFALLAEQEERLPCHLHMAKHDATYADPGTTAPQCAGRAIHWANQLKVPRRPDLLVLPKDTAAVFQWRHEFAGHHERGPLVERRGKR